MLGTRMALFCLLFSQGPPFSFAQGLANYGARHQVISPNTAAKVGVFLPGLWNLPGVGRLGLGGTLQPLLHPHTTLGLGCGES